MKLFKILFKNILLTVGAAIGFILFLALSGEYQAPIIRLIKCKDTCKSQVEHYLPKCTCKGGSSDDV